MNKLTTNEAVETLELLRNTLTTPKYREALEFALEHIATQPTVWRYRYECNAAGDLEAVYSVEVLADNEADARRRGESAIYAEYPAIRRFENGRLTVIA